MPGSNVPVSQQLYGGALGDVIGYQGRSLPVHQTVYGRQGCSMSFGHTVNGGTTCGYQVCSVPFIHSLEHEATSHD